MTTEPVRAGADWLALREPADAAARSTELVDELRRHLPAGGVIEVRDLGCGTGSMARWLAPRLPGPQHWVLYDRDAELLARATAEGTAVTLDTQCRDITRLHADELAGADLVTASALLDMMTADELGRFISGCVAAGCPVLVTLSVVGRAELVPADPLDQRVMNAFNDHQRRDLGGGPLLGPDAWRVAADAFAAAGLEVLVRPSPWRLGADRSALIIEWFDGWLAAACEQNPALVAEATPYAQRRGEQAAAGALSVTLHHADLLALPAG